MENYCIKTGTYSIVLGNGHFNKILDTKKSNSILCKISNFKITKHDETKYINTIKTINNYQYYYSIIDSTIYDIDKNSSFYSYLLQIVESNSINILKKDYQLGFCFINNEGDMELFDSLEIIKNDNSLNVWECYTNKKIKIFSQHILYAIYFLHQKKICHFDIKPENIIINTYINNSLSSFHRKFKLIDFGFAEMYPFKKYLKKPSGTVGYVPKKYKNLELYDCAYLPDKNPNDWYNGKHLSIVYPNNLNYSLYKTDSYAFGRTLFYLNYRLEEYFSKNIYKKSRFFCFKKNKNNYKNKNKKLIDLINQLTHNDIYFRLLPKQSLKLSFFIS